MSGSGVKIGMIVVKTKKCCWVVLGSIIPTTCGWLILPPTIRILGLIAMGFDVCQDRLNNPLPLLVYVASMTLLIGHLFKLFWGLSLGFGRVDTRGCGCRLPN